MEEAPFIPGGLSAENLRVHLPKKGIVKAHITHHLKNSLCYSEQRNAIFVSLPPRASAPFLFSTFNINASPRAACAQHSVCCIESISRARNMRSWGVCALSQGKLTFPLISSFFVQPGT